MYNTLAPLHEQIIPKKSFPKLTEMLWSKLLKITVKKKQTTITSSKQVVSSYQ